VILFAQHNRLVHKLERPLGIGQAVAKSLAKRADRGDICGPHPGCIGVFCRQQPEAAQQGGDRLAIFLKLAHRLAVIAKLKLLLHIDDEILHDLAGMVGA